MILASIECINEGIKPVIVLFISLFSVSYFLLLKFIYQLLTIAKIFFLVWFFFRNEYIP